MEKRITDLLDCLQDDTVQIVTRDAASTKNIMEATMNKINNSTPRRIGAKRFGTILVAAVLGAALLTGTAIALVTELPDWLFRLSETPDVIQSAQEANDILGNFAAAQDVEEIELEASECVSILPGDIWLYYVESGGGFESADDNREGKGKI